MPKMVSDRAAKFAEKVPIFMRTFPIIKQFYWQVKEIEEVKTRAATLAEELDWFGNED
jgi:hypothetical protein